MFSKLILQHKQTDSESGQSGQSESAHSVADLFMFSLSIDIAGHHFVL